MLPRRSIITLVTLAFLTPALVSRAQQAEYRLDEQGQWQAQRAPEPGTPEHDILRARQLLAEEKPGDAWSLLDTFIDKFDAPGHPLLAEAYLLRGDAKTAWGDEYKAFTEDYETLIRRFPESQEFVKANERELSIMVRYLNGLKRRLWGFRIADATGPAQDILVSIFERLRGSALGERAMIELGDYYYRDRDLESASIVYQYFERNYPASRYLKTAMERRIFTNIARFNGPRYESSGLVDARELLDRYVDRFPLEAEKNGLDAALSTRIDESLAAQLLDRARWYLRRSDPVSARFTFQKLTRLYPSSVAAARAREELSARGWATPDTATAASTKPDSKMATPPAAPTTPKTP